MISKFENPPERNRIHPFWFLNGDIREEELARQVLEMKEKGAGGFVLCARQGLTVPYLSREWFDLCEAAVSCAKREGMEVWLYDEFPYPSGMSGGEVTMLHPEACQHELVFTDSVTEEEKLTVSLGKVRLLSAMAYPVDGERTVWERGRNVADCAGRVIFCGLLPFEDIDGYDFAGDWGELKDVRGKMGRESYFSGTGTPEVCYPSERLACITAPGGLAACSAKEAVAEAVGRFFHPRTQIVIPGEARGAVAACRREDADLDYVFLTSCDGADTYFTVRAVAGCGFLEADPETGSVTSTPEKGSITRRLGPYESKLIGVTKGSNLREAAAAEGTAKAAEKTAEKTTAFQLYYLPLEEPWKVEIDGYNVLRFEKFRFSVEDSPWGETEPGTFPEQARDAGMMRYLPFDLKSSFGVPARPQIRYPVRLCYRGSFRVRRMPGEVFLMHDRSAVMGEYVVRINGIELDSRSFHEEFVYDKSNVLCDIRELVREGENLLEIRVLASEAWHGLTDPLYLLGDFGLDGDFALGEKPAEMRIRASYPQGYPFYSGRIRYSREINLSALTKGTVQAVSPEGTVQPVLPGGTVQAALPEGTVQPVLPGGTVQAALPEGTMQPVPPREMVRLALPEEAGIFECVTLWADGENLGTRAFCPYVWELPGNRRRGDACLITLTVSNTLTNMLEGSYYDYGGQRTAVIESEIIESEITESEITESEITKSEVTDLKVTD